MDGMEEGITSLKKDLRSIVEDLDRSWNLKPHKWVVSRFGDRKTSQVETKNDYNVEGKRSFSVDSAGKFFD